MPTSRQRHLITETEPVSRALDDAARRWPQDSASKTKLLLHLVSEGHQALRDQAERTRTNRVAAIRRTSGALPDAYGTAYLEQLREDWPE